MKAFDESKHPRDENGRFTDLESMSTDELKEKLQRELPEDDKGVGETEKKMTPAEKIASVHIDLNRDNILPELNDEDLEVLGVDRNKPVLLKKNVIDRNIGKHDDVTPEDSERMIGIALYSTKKEIIPNKDRSKPNYYSFASFVRVSKKDGSDMYGVVMIDVDDTKDAFEIVHWHYVPYDKLGNIKGK